MGTKSRVSVDDQKNFSQFLSFSGVQSAANAFLQIAIATNVTPQQEQVLILQEVQIYIDVLTASNNFTPAFEYTLTRASKASLPSMTDVDLLGKGGFLGLGGGVFSAGNTGMIENPFNMPWVGKEIVATPNIYMQFKTAGLSAACSVSGRVYFDIQSMPKDRILEVLYG